MCSGWDRGRGWRTSWKCVVWQGVVTPIGAVLTAETGDTTRSPGHQKLFPLGHGVTTVLETSRDPLEGGVIA